MADRNMTLPERLPEPGYYDHYKRDPDGTFNNYSYFIFAAGCNTEDCPPEQQFWLNYRPLYEAFVFKHGKMMDNRPLHMFFEPAIVNGVSVPRFTKITDPERIAKLSALRREMYPTDFL